MEQLKTIGIKKLKNGLSSYLRDVKSSVILLVTDHGKIVAEIRTPQKEYSQIRREALKKEWIDSNKLILPLKEKKTIARTGLSFPDGTAAGLLNGEREE